MIRRKGCERLSRLPALYWLFLGRVTTKNKEEQRNVGWSRIFIPGSQLCGLRAKMLYIKSCAEKECQVLRPLTRVAKEILRGRREEPHDHWPSSGDRRLSHEEAEANSHTSGCTGGTTHLDLLDEGGQHEQESANSTVPMDPSTQFKNGGTSSWSSCKSANWGGGGGGGGGDDWQSSLQNTSHQLLTRSLVLH